MKNAKVSLLTLLGICSLSACAVGPDYERPPAPTPQAYKELGEWSPAKPQDESNRGAWWLIYQDPILNDLEAQIDVSNQNLKAAEAAWRQARAISDQTEASLFPSLAISGTPTRSAIGTARPANNFKLNSTASWDVDVWGGIRRTLESDEANAEASAADLANARLSAQADLATDYFALRVQDELKRLLDATVEADQKSLEIVKNQYIAGIAAKADTLSAETQLESVKASAINADLKRKQLEHAIAILVGKTPADFNLPATSFTLKLPEIPVELPSTLLERRPDIASAERKMAATNAQIGAETAAWFPNVTLNGSYGYSSAALGKLVQASNSLWSFGPTIAETIFDAGARSARINAAEAGYEASVATYRQTVLTAFQQVEDNLAAIHILQQQAVSEDAAVKAARDSEHLTLNQYKQGIVPYLNVLTAQTVALNNEENALNVTASRLNAHIALLKALGGGWNAKLLKTEE